MYKYYILLPRYAGGNLAERLMYTHIIHAPSAATARRPVDALFPRSRAAAFYCTSHRSAFRDKSFSKVHTENVLKVSRCTHNIRVIIFLSLSLSLSTHYQYTECVIFKHDPDAVRENVKNIGSIAGYVISDRKYDPYTFRGVAWARGFLKFFSVHTL